MAKGMSLTVLLLAAAVAAGQSWVARYDGPAGDEDEARAIAVEASGAVAVTGTSWGGPTANDIATVKYDAAGAEQWAARYNGPAGGSDEGRAVVVDAAGNVFVTGGSAGPDLMTDALTVSYDAGGGEQWAARYDGAQRGNDFGLAIALVPDGVVTAGYTGGDTMGWDFLTLKYDAGGGEQWAAVFPAGDEDYAVTVAVDRSGDIYVAGNSGSPYTLSWDYVLVKYEGGTGETLWTRRYNGPADESDEVCAVAVDPEGNVIVTGSSADPTTNLDFTTIKYSATGEMLWLRRYDGPAQSADRAYALAVDEAGNVHVAGSSPGAGTDADYAVVKYSPDGTQQWVARYDGPVSGFDEARSVAVDRAGNVFVTGSSAGSGTRSDYATVKYSPTGAELWVERYDGPASRADGAAAIALDGAGNPCVTGWSAGSGTGLDYATVRYPASGVAETHAAPGFLPQAGPSVVRGAVVLSGPESRAELLDAAGRRVMSLRAGANDVSRLARGVYFLRGGRGIQARVVLVD